MILLTGATGLVGSALLRRLLDAGEEVRCLVRDPRRLGPNRVRVQITLGDLADPVSLRQAVRGVDDGRPPGAPRSATSPAASIEELNGMATIRLLREAERAGVERFVFFSALGADADLAHALLSRQGARRAGGAGVATSRRSVLAPSIVYAPGDPWLTLLGRMMHLPWMPIAGSGERASSRSGPRTSRPRADAVLDAQRLERRGGSSWPGPDVLTYEDIVKLALEVEGRRAPADPSCRWGSCGAGCGRSSASPARRRSPPGRRPS